MNEEITVVIVDDDPVSIRNLSNDLMTYPDIQILETTTSVEKAQKIIIRQQPDLLFLDVEMPKQSTVRIGVVEIDPIGCACQYASCFLYRLRFLSLESVASFCF